MKKNLIFSAILICALYSSQLYGIDVEQYLAETPEASDLVVAIEKVFRQLGYIGGASGFKQEWEELDKQYFEKPVQELQKSMPDDINEFKHFLHKLTDGAFNESSYGAIKNMCKEFENGDVLAFVINQLLINYIRGKLIEHYIGKHHDLKADEKAALQAMSFDWCSCTEAPLQKRLALILNAVKEVKKKFQSNEHIVITSLGSGNMLNEYALAIALRYIGYTSMTVNLIDFEYKYIGSTDPEGMKSKALAQVFAKRLNLDIHFCLSGDIDAGPGAVNVFESGFDYIKACKNNGLLRSTVMIIVDAGVCRSSSFEKQAGKAYSPDINRVELTVKQKSQAHKERYIIAYMMHYGKPRLYWDRLIVFGKNRLHELMAEVAHMAESIEKDRLTDTNAYHSTFISNVVEIMHKKVTEWESLPELKEIVTSQLQNLLPQDKLEMVIDGILKQFITKKSLSPIIINKVYINDPYAAFQEFVIDGLREHGDAFMLGADKLIHIDVEFLKKTGGYSLFEKYGDKESRCITRSPEFIEQQI